MTSQPAAITDVPAAVIDDPRRRRAILWAVCIALMAVVSSVSGLNVAQPQLATALDASQGEVIWIINSYTLTMAALLLPLGALGDRLSRKPVLLSGLLIFAVANIAAVLAPSFMFMLGARVLSGIGAAMIMPVTLSVITASFPEETRAKGIGMWTAVAGGGSILGMYLSAFLVDFASWRWLFALPITLTTIAVILGIRVIPNSRETTSGRFDLVGAITSIIATISLTFALHEAPTHGWAGPLVIAALSTAALTLGLFIWWESRVSAPMLDIRRFRTRGLSSGSALLIVLFGVQSAVALVLYPFFQIVLGWNGLLSTLGQMPIAVLMMLASALAARVSERLGMRATMIVGLSIATIGIALMAALVSPTGGYLSVLPGLIAIGLGAGLAMTPSTLAITSSLPTEQQGVASALNDLTRELGSALGIALLGGLLIAGYQNAISGRLDGVPSDLADTAREGLANAAEASRHAGAHAQQILHAAQDAFTAGWQQSMWICVAIMIALTLLTAFRGPRNTSRNSQE